MKTLRNFLLLFALAFSVNTASAQFSFGPLATLDANFNTLGAGARAAYDINSQFRATGEVIIYFETGVTPIGVNANVNYILSDTEGGLHPYLLGGINYTSFSVDTGFGKVTFSNTGLNVGGGLDLPIGGIAGWVEAKFAIGGQEFGVAAGLYF